MCENCNDHLEGGNIIHIIEPSLPFCQDCGDDNSCIEKIDTACVVYHLDHPLKPSKLQNLGMPNGATAEEIFEAIDDLVGNGLNIPLDVEDTTTIDLTATGPAKHHLKADVKISADAGNSIVVKDDGLYSAGSEDSGKVKVDAGDPLDYLEDQVVGGTDGIVSIDIQNEDGLLAFLPNIDLAKLVNELGKREDFVTLICNIVQHCQAQCPNVIDIIMSTEPE